MANGNQVSVQGPDGNTYQFPPGTDKTAAIAYFKKKGIGAPDLKTGAGMQEKAQAQARAKSTSMPMKTSALPEIVKGVGYTLPAIGGIAGGLAGAPAFGAGGLVGAGLGTAAGETARQAIFKGIFDEGPSPSSKEGLKQTSVAGGLAALSEVPGAILTSAGNRVVKNIALAKSPQQVGDAIEGLMQSRPAGMSGKALQRDLLLSHRELSKDLGKVLGAAQGTADIDAALAPSVQKAANITAANPELKATSKYLDKLIAAAKVNAGIQGSQASATQLMSFQNELKKLAYEAKPGPVQKVVQNLLKDGYRSVGQEITRLSPESEEILKQMTNIHAARSAVKGYQPGRAASLAATAALHPRATAMISPVATGAAVVGAYKMAPEAKKVAEEVIP